MAGNRNFLAGLSVTLLAAIGFVTSGSLAFGSAAHMGPGFLPRVIFALLIAFGIIIVFLKRDAEEGVEEQDPPMARPILFILASILAFAVSLERLGFVAALVLSVTLSVAAVSPISIRRIAGVSVVLLLLCLAVFIYGLGVNISLWPQ